VSKPLGHNGKLSRVTSFLALKENDEMRQQNKNFASNVIETSELLSFFKKSKNAAIQGDPA
jgi:hypothetical protein